jgi:membrane-associated phospholipid phosphatase
MKDIARAVPIIQHNNYENSFPSGHTSTAFTTALLLAYLVKRRFAVLVFPFIAFLVAYSRVYLAQHFVTDVMAGTLVGIVSSYLALLIYEQFRKKKLGRQKETSP